MSTDKSIEELESLHKDMVSRRDSLKNNVNRIIAARDERKRILRESIEECKREGFNPDTLGVDIQHLKQVLMTKMDVMNAELSDAENMIRPMLREIEKG